MTWHVMSFMLNMGAGPTGVVPPVIDVPDLGRRMTHRRRIGHSLRWGGEEDLL